MRQPLLGWRLVSSLVITEEIGFDEGEAVTQGTPNDRRGRSDFAHPHGAGRRKGSRDRRHWKNPHIGGALDL
jgi:hypothetical protein